MVPDLAKAAVAAGADGLMIEVHNNPAKAKCDGAQRDVYKRQNQVFIWVENAKLVTIENTDNHTVTLNGQHFYDLSTASNGVESLSLIHI